MATETDARSAGGLVVRTDALLLLVVVVVVET